MQAQLDAQQEEIEGLTERLVHTQHVNQQLQRRSDTTQTRLRECNTKMQILRVCLLPFAVGFIYGLIPVLSCRRLLHCYWEL